MMRFKKKKDFQVKLIYISESMVKYSLWAIPGNISYKLCGMQFQFIIKCIGTYCIFFLYSHYNAGLFLHIEPAFF